MALLASVTTDTGHVAFLAVVRTMPINVCADVLIDLVSNYDVELEEASKEKYYSLCLNTRNGLSKSFQFKKKLVPSVIIVKGYGDGVDRVTLSRRSFVYYNEQFGSVELHNTKRACRLASVDDFFDHKQLFATQNILQNNYNFTSELSKYIIFICDMPDYDNEEFHASNIVSKLEQYYTDTVTVRFHRRILDYTCDIYILTSEPFNCANSVPDVPLFGRALKFGANTEKQHVPLSTSIARFYAGIYDTPPPTNVLAVKNLIECEPDFELVYRTSEGTYEVERNQIHVCGPEGQLIGRTYLCRPKFVCGLFPLAALLTNNVSVTYENKFKFLGKELAIYSANLTTSASFACVYANHTIDRYSPITCGKDGWTDRIPMCDFYKFPEFAETLTIRRSSSNYLPALLGITFAVLVLLLIASITVNVLLKRRYDLVSLENKELTDPEYVKHYLGTRYRANTLDQNYERIQIPDHERYTMPRSIADKDYEEISNYAGTRSSRTDYTYYSVNLAPGDNAGPVRGTYLEVVDANPDYNARDSFIVDSVSRRHGRV